MWSNPTSISAPAFFKKLTKSITCGSIAAKARVVFQDLSTLAVIKFSVAVTANHQFRVLSQTHKSHDNFTKSSQFKFLYQIASSHLMCSSIGLFQILHHPGYGIFTSPNL
ncbi:TPA: hypothetical protein DEG21_00465 [Patescibacteria group bacterium]|nr:hypothetical protein [Candidatus Gracilibacteria bacterium]HBY74400.1 hypothetical protein [Candidatus Gracilibacteria bacterium]